MSAIQRLAGWLATTPAASDEEACRRARNAFLDTIGCALAGSGADSARAVQAALRPWGEGRARILGSGLTAPAPWAALANGTAAHALDLDDCDRPANSHPSAVLVPALIALAEERGFGGRAVLDAYIAGLEVQMRIGEAINLSHYHQGWHATSTIGAIGAAAACARLLGLDTLRCGHALSLATSKAGGFLSQFGTMAKPAHAGFAAKAGVVAACLAEAGLTAAPETLDGPRSLLSMMSGPAAQGFSEPLAKLGRPLAILEHGLIVKRYPCCSYIHRAVDGLLALRAEHGLSAEKVKQITIEIPGRHTEILSDQAPETPSQARFSMPYCIAVALHRGSLTESDFSEGAVARPELGEIMRRVDFRGLPVTDASSDLATEEADRVTVSCRDGQEHRIEVLYARGDPRNPLSERELLGKFDDCAGTVLSPDGIAAARQALLALEEQTSLAAVTATLTPGETALSVAR